MLFKLNRQLGSFNKQNFLSRYRPLYTGGEGQEQSEPSAFPPPTPHTLSPYSVLNNARLTCSNSRPSGPKLLSNTLP